MKSAEIIEKTLSELIEQLNWAQRHRVAVLLYKSDRAAVEAVPEPLRTEMRHLCDEHSLRDLASAFDPATEGVLVDGGDSL
jgi:hypothetical protein